MPQVLIHASSINSMLIPCLKYAMPQVLSIDPCLKYWFHAPSIQILCFKHWSMLQVLIPCFSCVVSALQGWLVSPSLYSHLSLSEVTPSHLHFTTVAMLKQCRLQDGRGHQEVWPTPGPGCEPRFNDKEPETGEKSLYLYENVVALQFLLGGGCGCHSPLVCPAPLE